MEDFSLDLLDQQRALLMTLEFNDIIEVMKRGFCGTSSLVVFDKDCSLIFNNGRHLHWMQWKTFQPST